MPADFPFARCCAALAALAPAVTVTAQEISGAEGAPLEQIVVVAHKSERRVRDIAATVTVVSRDDIDAMLATSVADVFRYTPGIDHEASGTRFGTEGINIRGIGGNRVAILVDGVPLSDQFDIGSFSNATRDFLNAGLMERVEVLHGPASALYGSAAIGGVVAVRTPDPADVATAGRAGGNFAATWHGADRSTHGTGLFAVGDAALGLLLGGSLRSGHELESSAVDTNVDFRHFDRESAIAKFVADDRFGRTWRVGFIHQAAEVRTDLNSVLGTGRFRSTTALEGDDDYAMNLLTVEYEFGTPESRVDAGMLRVFLADSATTQWTLDERARATNPVSIDRFFSFEQQIRGVELNLQKDFATGPALHRIAAGIEYRVRETTEFRDGLSTNLADGTATNVILGEAFPLRDFPVSESAEWGAYAENVITVGDWTVIAALRADRYSLDPQNDAMYAEDYPFASPVSVTASDLSPKLALIHRLGRDTDVYIQYAHGFRAPPYADANIGLDIPAFNYRAVPNPDLRSETSDGFDAGLRWHGEHSTLHLSLFHTRYADFIASKLRIGTDPVSGRVLFQSRNLAHAVIEGVEAGGQAALGGRLDGVTIDGAFYLARGENRENGQPLNSVGPAQAVFGLTWTRANGRQRVRLQSTIAAAWDDRDTTRGDEFEPAGYAVVDLYVRQEIGQRTTITGGLRNVFDRTYWNWSDLRGLAATDPLVPQLARPGRSLSLGINYHW